ncbi:N,N-dimethyltransferase [Planctomycetales bacterium]|nr:N,N-dimethyltransferase [Planctomycetales bacterium]
MSIQSKTGSVYDYPNLYDVLFSDSCKLEIDFLTAALRKYCNKKRKYSIFEPACGTGRLLWRLAKLGHDAVGLDLNPKAVAFCNRRLRRHSFPESVIQGDMTAFQLADLQRTEKFDLAYNFVSSFLHLITEKAAQAHLHAVAEILKPGGIYLLGLHLQPQGTAVCSHESWSVRHGALAVKSQLGQTGFDRKRRLEMVEFRIEAETSTKRYKIVDTFPLRMYSARQFNEFLIAVNRFDVLETFTFDYDINQPIQVNRLTEDVVFVLKKR